MAQHASLEVSRHELPAGTPLEVTPPDDSNDSEVICILSGRLLYRGKDAEDTLGPGDCIAAHEALSTEYFEAETDTVILQVTSFPSFSLMEEDNRHFFELAEKIEADEQMEGHSKRLEEMAWVIARRMGLSAESLFHLRLAAYFHDIGKSRIPQHILQKPVSLADEEWETVKRHSDWGREILQQHPKFERVGEIVEQIHERVDGTGYPRGLTGGQICTEAKIITVVDAYDAMTSDRTYRKRMRHESALEELKANSGTQFDPQVVEAFLQEFSDQPPVNGQHAKPDMARWSQTESFLELGERILIGQDLGEILENVVSAITQHTPFQRAALALYDQPITPDSIEKVSIQRTAQSGLSPEEEIHLNANPLPPAERKKIFRSEFRLSRSFYIPADRNPWGERPGFVAGHLNLSAGTWHPEDMLFIPLWLSEDELLGLISVDDPRDGRAPTPSAIEPLEMFANLAALAIEKARYISELREFQQRLKGVYRLSEELGRLNDVDTVLQRGVNIIRENFDYDHVCVLINEAGELKLRAFESRLPEGEIRFERFQSIPFGEGITGWVARSKETALVDDVQDDPRFIAGHGEIRSELAVPMIGDDEVIGVLNIESVRPAAFTERDRDLLEALGRQLAMAIANLRQKDRLQELATHDSLTGAYNRHYFAEYISTEKARARRYGHPISLLLIDFDRFHEINDMHGHLEGDRLLCEATRVFRENVRDADTLVRYGGDEFIILMPEIDRSGAERAGERIQESLAASSLGTRHGISISIGVSTWSPEDGKSFEDVLEEADRWMYRRKGKNVLQ